MSRLLTHTYTRACSCTCSLHQRERMASILPHLRHIDISMGVRQFQSPCDKHVIVLTIRSERIDPRYWLMEMSEKERQNRDEHFQPISLFFISLSLFLCLSVHFRAVRQRRDGFPGGYPHVWLPTPHQIRARSVAGVSSHWDKCRA